MINSLTADSYAGARDLYEISCPAMAAMIEAMRSAPGIVGARQSGTGFGGCMVAFVTSDCVDEFAQRVQDAYSKRTGIQPKVYAVQPAPGAGPLQFSLTQDLAAKL